MYLKHKPHFFTHSVSSLLCVRAIRLLFRPVSKQRSRPQRDAGTPLFGTGTTERMGGGGSREPAFRDLECRVCFGTEMTFVLASTASREVVTEHNVRTPVRVWCYFTMAKVTSALGASCQVQTLSTAADEARFEMQGVSTAPERLFGSLDPTISFWHSSLAWKITVAGHIKRGALSRWQMRCLFNILTTR